jgi:hypothetical protein
MKRGNFWLPHDVASIENNPPIAVLSQRDIAGILAATFAMEAKIEAPRPRTFGALLFVPGATLRKQGRNA